MNNKEYIERGRFAPSPTGRMHLGNVFSALLSWLSIKAQGGKWVLRIEDIDPQRSRMEYADLIMSDLEWLGLTWDEGPFYQSERGEIYEAELQKLADRGMTYRATARVRTYWLRRLRTRATDAWCIRVRAAI
ncbi:glutamate--tRNA ligase family protein [Leyella stercorea]|uniref:glutamate--tRNA ligase family protein n=1 Tax=Leyella stercorea TaxID=363265 RepID=UPI0024316AE9|nr:glutamate--tRNA ligase family protein [Leyella stercorea]